MSDSGGYVEYSKKDKRWNCYINLKDSTKHVGYASTEARAQYILRDSLDRQGL